nr:hypothetical protein HmN_000086400 [Hymenolepis microstoma]
MQLDNALPKRLYQPSSIKQGDQHSGPSDFFTNVLFYYLKAVADLHQTMADTLNQGLQVLQDQVHILQGIIAQVLFENNLLYHKVCDLQQQNQKLTDDCQRIQSAFIQSPLMQLFPQPPTANSAEEMQRIIAQLLFENSVLYHQVCAADFSASIILDCFQKSLLQIFPAGEAIAMIDRRKTCCK